MADVNPWDVLFSKTQQRLLAVLFVDSASSGFSYAELLRRTRGGAGAIHRELRQFVDAGLLTLRDAGGHRLYAANTADPLYPELRSLAQKLVNSPTAHSASHARSGLDSDTASKLAKKYLWWKKPEDAVSDPRRLVAQVMNMGDYADVQRVASAVGDEFLRTVIRNAEAGQFNERSWTYWNYRLGLAKPGAVPPLPARAIV
jgi:hypothetical protein